MQHLSLIVQHIQTLCAITCSNNENCQSFQLGSDGTCHLGGYHSSLEDGSETCYTDDKGCFHFVSKYLNELFSGFSKTGIEEDDNTIIATYPTWGPGFEISFDILINSERVGGVDDFAWVLTFMLDIFSCESSSRKANVRQSISHHFFLSK